MDNATDSARDSARDNARDNANDHTFLDDEAAVVTAFGAAWGAHDLDAAMSMCTSDCVFESTGPAPDGVRHSGHDAVRHAWEPIFADTASHFTVEDTVHAGDRVVQTWRYEWADGHVRGIDVFRIRDGKVAEKLAYVKG
jgi:ketosteroid isomerase-like protein